MEGQAVCSQSKPCVQKLGAECCDIWKRAQTIRQMFQMSPHRWPLPLPALLSQMLLQFNTEPLSPSHTRSTPSLQPQYDPTPRSTCHHCHHQLSQLGQTLTKGLVHSILNTCFAAVSSLPRQSPSPPAQQGPVQAFREAPFRGNSLFLELLEGCRLGIILVSEQGVVYC